MKCSKKKAVILSYLITHYNCQSSQHFHWILFHVHINKQSKVHKLKYFVFFFRYGYSWIPWLRKYIYITAIPVPFYPAFQISPSHPPIHVKNREFVIAINVIIAWPVCIPARKHVRDVKLCMFVCPSVWTWHYNLKHSEQVCLFVWYCLLFILINDSNIYSKRLLLECYTSKINKLIKNITSKRKCFIYVWWIYFVGVFLLFLPLFAVGFAYKEKYCVPSCRVFLSLCNSIRDCAWS